MEEAVEDMEEDNVFYSSFSTMKTAEDIITMEISPYNKEELNWN
jgi:hypothetical protein